MNPGAAVILGLGLLMLLVGFKGTQDNVASALLGKPYGKTTLPSKTGGPNIGKDLLGAAGGLL